MNEVEKHTLSVEDQKAKIRQRYKGIDTDLIDIIPCITQEDFYNDTSEKRVAVYARVSTDGINQTSSYELQKNHYEDMINKRPGWTLVDIYADEGISGTSLQHRDAFKRLILMMLRFSFLAPARMKMSKFLTEDALTKM